jgi:hypothetical protein
MTSSTSQAQAPTAAQKQELAKQAYIYGFPMVDFYRILFGYFIDSKSPAYVGPFNAVHNVPRVYTPADTAIQTPNSDTPYSFLGLDLRSDAVVLTLPPIEEDRYYSVQFVDQYTFNIAYVGTRTTGNGGGTFLIAGPAWKGDVPDGITKVIRFDTSFGLAGIRTQLFDASDLDNVKKIQTGYSAQTLSAHLGSPQPAAPAVEWLPPLSPEEERTSPKAFNLLAFILSFCPVDASEAALRKQFESIGIVPGKPFDPGSATSAYTAGMAAGQQEIDKARAQVKSANDLFGTRDFMQNNYLNRAVAAQYGILGNTATEAVYLGYQVDSAGKPLAGSNRYTVRFAKGDLPPVNAFWSLTMYNLPQQLLVANPLNRYLLNSPMLSDMKRDADGGLTLYIQHDSPGGETEPNWLPAPSGPFMIIVRLYSPMESALTGQWKLPPLEIAK